MAIRALVFDLDGLILDTESTGFAAWEVVYRDHGVPLPRELWMRAIGSDDRHFDPSGHLERALGRRLAPAVHDERRLHRDALIRALGPLPGVVDTLAAAERRRLRLGVASSSPRAWVAGHLERLGLRGRFHALATADDVERVKPDPAVYRAALGALEAEPREAIAFEDSPHGVAAAKDAGLFCVAVPGPMTRGLDFARADLVLDSLAERALDELLELAGP